MIYFHQQNNLYLPTDQGDVPLEKRWRRSPYVSHVEQDGEQVLLHMRTGKFYGLDLVGSQIWTILERQRDINGIVQELGAAHNVSPEVLQRDALALMRTLEKHKLVISG